MCQIGSSTSSRLRALDFGKYHTHIFRTARSLDVRCTSIFSMKSFVRYEYLLGMLEVNIVLESGGNRPCHGKFLKCWRPLYLM